MLVVQLVVGEHLEKKGQDQEVRTVHLKKRRTPEFSLENYAKHCTGGESGWFWDITVAAGTRCKAGLNGMELQNSDLKWWSGSCGLGALFLQGGSMNHLRRCTIEPMEPSKDKTRISIPNNNSQESIWMQKKIN